MKSTALWFAQRHLSWRIRGTALLLQIMFLPLVGLLLLGGARCALAEPVYMVCKGEDYFQTGPKQARTVEDTVSVTIDMDPANNAGTAQVGGYKEATVLQAPNDKNVVTIVGDLQTKSGLRSGPLDRVAGELYLDLGMFEGLPKSFIGTCRPSKKLF
jgi:hypothetical protein